MNLDERDRPCQDIHQLLVPYLDGELDETLSADVVQHLAACRKCKRLLEEHEAVSTVIRNWPRPSNSLNPVRTVAEVRRRVWRSRRRRILSAAALLLVGVLLGLVLMQRETAPREDLLILRDLEVLEAIQEEVGEVSPELVNLLLEVAATPEELDERVFDYVLEEELAEDKL